MVGAPGLKNPEPDDNALGPCLWPHQPGLVDSDGSGLRPLWATAGRGCVRVCVATGNFPGDLSGPEIRLACFGQTSLFGA